MTDLDIGLFVPGDDGDAASPPVRLGVDRLRRVVAAGGGRVRERSRPDAGADDGRTLVIAGSSHRLARAIIDRAGITVPPRSETVSILPEPADEAGTLLVSGSDPRGLAYAVHDVADRVEYSTHPASALRIPAPVVEAPANKVRSITRLFCSEVEDKQWFYDRAFWDAYFSMLVAQRFNRFSLTLGLGYNYPENITDGYFYFAYPFLVDLSGYDVRVPQLPHDERDRNLETLRHVSDLAHAHGLDFQLGLWTHAYRWFDSPHAQHTIEGLVPADHGAYCRDAIRALLEACPAIDGVTLRIHGEGGVPERSWGFWRLVFDGIASCGRPVGIDLHAKGLDGQILGDALETGLPVTVSPKFWAEHLGPPYHQAAIRESERPPREDPSHLSEWHSHMAVSEGSRPFTRYGYGDFLREDRPYDLVFRVWAGTQRLLLWGDPAFAAGYGRAAGLAGSDGLEMMEPLTFKGREGTGIDGPRTGYIDPGLRPEFDWQKYEYTYRLLGRLSYDPGASPEAWRPLLRARLGSIAAAAEEALASASRILPLITVAHHQSASNNYFWPEMYTSMPIVESLAADLESFLIDTPAPKRFGTVVPLDPEVFMSITDFVDEMDSGIESGRIGPLQVAAWLDDLARRAGEKIAGWDPADPEARRWLTDIAIQAHLGRFYAGKLRAGTYYEIHLSSGGAGPLRSALEEYARAREAWTGAAAAADGVYDADLTFGPQPWIRGHWRDRLSAIDEDMAALASRLVESDSGSRETWQPPDLRNGEAPVVVHTPPQHYTPGGDLALAAEVNGDGVEQVVVRYRAMNQAHNWSQRAMEGGPIRYETAIPADQIDPAYPLAYAFVVRDRDGRAWRWPGLGPDLSGVPYHVVRRLGGPR